MFSLYQDLYRGKATEVDHINGHVVQLARANGTDAPRNELVTDMVHELERREAATFFDREEVIERFGALRRPGPQAA